MKKRFLFLFFLISYFISDSQTGCWIYLKDKPGASFSPYEYFDIKTIQRRIQQQIPLTEFSDLPVSESYINQISALCSEVIGTSRWLNAIAAYVPEASIAIIRNLPFVLEVVEVSTSSDDAQALSSVQYSGSVHPAQAAEDTGISDNQRALLEFQTERMGRSDFEKAYINGKGIRIAIFDGGFPGVENHPVFQHIRDRNGVVKTWDFWKNEENVYHGISHGTAVLSCIAGIYQGTPMGLATGADFLLARTEHGMRENLKEEFTWAAAAEWADKNGADIINSSLGYTKHRYFPEQMDGRTAAVSRAAAIAASKGILVVNSAGNEGSERWRTIGAPSDNDSVLAAGAIDPYTDLRISFSSYGPNRIGHIKPNVCAHGQAVCALKGGGLGILYGTSFSAPLLAGFAACALQRHPGTKPVDAIRMIERAGHLYPYYDYSHGYGVPQAKFVLPNAHPMPEPTIEFIMLGDSLKWKVDQKFLADTIPATRNLFIHVEKSTGGLKCYWADTYVKQEDYGDGILGTFSLWARGEGVNDGLPQENEIVSTLSTVFQWYYLSFEEGDIIRIHFEGYTAEYTIKNYTK